MPLTLRYVARSDVGLIREGNEDSGYAGPYLLAVADGMGGHAAGEVASQAAIEELVQAEHVATRHDPLEALSAAITAANERIRQLIADDPSREGMGTTVTALLWTGTSLGMGHIGDSRAYLLRDGQISQLSHDHTFVQSLVDEGRLTLEEAGVHPARSLILKALQGQGQVDPDLVVVDVTPGDRLLVCSDGLSGVVSDETLGEAMASVQQLDEVADELVRLALAGGAPDNVTLIVADVVETDTPRAPDDTAEAFLVGAATGDHPPAKRPHRRRPRAALRVLLGGEEKPWDPEDLEALRYAPRPPRRFRWVRRLAVLVAIALIGWGALSLGNSWVRSQYYVGHSAGEVAIFQGLSQEIGPIRLSELYEVPPGLPVEALPTLYRNQVEETITADTVEDALEIVSTLRLQACRASESQQPETPTDEPDPTGTPDATRTPGPDRTPNPTGTPGPNRTPGSTGTPGAARTPPQTDGASTQPADSEPTETPAPPDSNQVDPDGWRPADADLDCTEVG